MGLIASFLGLGCIIHSISGDFTVPAERAATPEYKLLDRWVRYSCFPAKDFPTTEIARKVLSGWAQSELCSRARALNIAYAEQEGYEYAIGSSCDSMADPKEICSIISAIYHERDCAEIRVRRAKEEYLGFWDLVAKGREESVGILKGPEWQDPEVFRQKILKEDGVR